jgi:S-(hydroxymethyl)glutathione dehydrogenase/alcohol dehydrogenase
MREVNGEISRRDLLAAGGATVGMVAAGSATAASTAPQRTTAPSKGGRKFKALVVDGPKVSVEEVQMLPLAPRGVAIRTEASAPCYTMVIEGLRGAGPTPRGVLNSGSLYILGHSAVGIVEEVGSLVQRVQVGDRVLVPNAPQCGQCYHCLTGAAQFCGKLHQDSAPVATLDGRPVGTRGGISGLAELTITSEEGCVPIWTDAPAAELALLADTGSIGLASGICMAPIEPGTDVVVQGCGPVGLSAVQAARIKGAAQIIAIEPIAERRELARRFGATTVLDPNAEGDGLVEKIRDMCKGPTNRALAGGRVWDSDKNFPRGPDYTIEAAGAEKMVPARERGPDPTGVLPLSQAWAYTRAGGHVTYLSVGQPGDLALDVPAWQFINRGRIIHAGHMGGLQPMRDLPRFVRLLERGLYQAKPMVTRTYALTETRQAFEDIGRRTVVAGVVTF